MSEVLAPETALAKIGSQVRYRTTLYNHVVRAIIKKEMYIFFKLFYAEASFAILFPVLMLLSMRFGFGTSTAGSVDDAYIQFIAPGMLMMSAISTAVFNTGFIMMFEKVWSSAYEGVALTPARIWEVVLAKVLAGSFKGTINGALTIIIITPILDLPITWRLLGLIPLLFCATFLFSAIGLILGVSLRYGYHLGSLANLIIFPTSMLGGMFFEIDQIGIPWLEAILMLSPVTHQITGLRATMGVGVLPYDEVFWIVALAMLVSVIWAVPLYWVTMKVFKAKTVQ